MRAPAWLFAVVVGSPTVALADPKPTTVDVAPIRDHLVVLQDAHGGTYAVAPGTDGRAFFGAGKTLYEQIVTNRLSDGETGGWDIGVWAPRVTRARPGSIVHRADGSFAKFCGDTEVGLTLITGDKAKLLLDKSSFLSSALIRRPHLLARDDSGVYYYVDVIRDEYGGNGFRVFVGKKGAMKQLPLSDIASDTAGEVFATKTGDLRIVHDEATESDETSAHASVTWVHGERRSKLVKLDVDMNSRLIFKDLGIYSFMGTICDDV